MADTNEPETIQQVLQRRIRTYLINKRASRQATLAEEIDPDKRFPIGFWLKVIKHLSYPYARSLYDRLKKDPKVRNPAAVIINEWKQSKPKKQIKLI